MNLCKWKDIFGKPKEGMHKYRIFGMATVDLVATILLAYVISLSVPRWNFFIILAVLLALSVVVHKMFCVKTTLSEKF